jgi:hypothetical protein
MRFDSQGRSSPENVPKGVGGLHLIGHSNLVSLAYSNALSVTNRCSIFDKGVALPGVVWSTPQYGPTIGESSTYLSAAAVPDGGHRKAAPAGSLQAAQRQE